MEMLNYREKYNKKIAFYSLIFLMIHIPIFAVVAYLYKTELWIAVGLSSVFLALGIVSYIKFPTHRFTLGLIAVIGICYSAILIHLGRGLIELHFHIFVILGILPIYGYITPLILAAATAAIHHLGFFYILPESVFNYKASIYTVLLHAVFVVFETGFCLVIAYRFRHLIEMQTSTMPKLNLWSTELNKSAFELSKSSSSLAEKSNQQATALNDSSSALHEITTIVENNLVNVEISTGVAEQVLSKSGEAQTAFNDLSQCMKEITKASERLDRLFSAINEIGEKTKLIDDIVFKTQLLSFNASLEAERAGEHGRGFAVVAEEVGILAKVSGESADAISQIVKSAVTEAKDVVEMSKRLAYDGEQYCGTSGLKMNEVVNFSQKILNLSREIMNACKEESLGLKQISNSLETLNTNTQENLNEVNKSNGTTEALLKQASQMKMTVEKIEENTI